MRSDSEAFVLLRSRDLCRNKALVNAKSLSAGKADGVVVVMPGLKLKLCGAFVLQIDLAHDRSTGRTIREAASGTGK
jgi:hypothetical protein